MKVSLKNCEGIHSLENLTFDFSEDSRLAVIYARNGTMKTSFMKTMNSISNNLEVGKNIYFDEEPYHIIKFNETPIEPDQIHPIFTFDERIKFTDLNAYHLLSDETSKVINEFNESILSIEKEFLDDFTECWIPRKSKDNKKKFKNDMRKNIREAFQLNNDESFASTILNIRDFFKDDENKKNIIVESPLNHMKYYLMKEHKRIYLMMKKQEKI